MASPSRLRFEQVRRHVMELDEVLALIGEGGRSGKRSENVHVSGGDNASPVELAVLWSMTTGAEVLEKLEKRRDDLIESIGDALCLLESMRAQAPNGIRMADVIERYYIDLCPWDQVASEQGIKIRQVFRLSKAGFEWLDNRGR